MEMNEISRRIGEQEVVDLAKRIVGFDTTNPPGNELECAEFLATVMGEIGLKTEVQVIDSSRANAVGYSSPQREGPTLLLEGHIDTAPLELKERRLWLTDPFSGCVQNGRIFGKGIVDMKGGLTAILVAVKAVLKSGVDLKGNLKVAALADELGFMLGVKHFIKSGLADDVDGCISTEPIWGVQTTYGGRTWGKITVVGRSAVSNLDPTFAFKSGLGNNAIHQATRLLHELATKRPSHPTHSLFGRSWWHVLKISGGWDPENTPMCPGTCEIVLEGRLVPGQSVSEFWKDVGGIIAKVQRKSPGFRAKVDVLERRPAYSVRETHPLVRTVANAYEEVIGRAPVMNPLGYPMNVTGDHHYFAAKGIPCVTIGPAEPRKIQAKQMFVANESLDIEKIIQTARILVVAITRYLT